MFLINSFDVQKKIVKLETISGGPAVKVFILHRGTLTSQSSYRAALSCQPGQLSRSSSLLIARITPIVEPCAKIQH